MVKGYVDSAVFAIDSIDKIKHFGTLEVVKNGLLFKRELLPKFKLPENGKYYDYLALLTTTSGYKYQIVHHTRAKQYKIIFRGLWQHTKISDYLRADLLRFIELHGDKATLARIDIAFDQPNPHNIKAIAKNTKRRTYKYRATTYLKTLKEKKTNQYLDIKHYKKTPSIYRLEFVFKNERYLTIEKIRTQITKATAATLEVEPLLLHLISPSNAHKPHTANRPKQRGIFKTILFKMGELIRRTYQRLKSKRSTAPP
ncbi:MAG: hypothetical protein LBQ18_00140 [Campylobacteraceae bacterium]|jgi:hypothetical protein|nr:hypothetical protein [Campylobacteraceae bacterium]